MADLEVYSCVDSTSMLVYRYLEICAWVYGSLPRSIWKRMIPRDQMSMAYCSPRGLIVKQRTGQEVLKGRGHCW